MNQRLAKGDFRENDLNDFCIPPIRIVKSTVDIISNLPIINRRPSNDRSFAQMLQ